MRGGDGGGGGSGRGVTGAAGRCLHFTLLTMGDVCGFVVRWDGASPGRVTSVSACPYHVIPSLTPCCRQNDGRDARWLRWQPLSKTTSPCFLSTQPLPHRLAVTFASSRSLIPSTGWRDTCLGGEILHALQGVETQHYLPTCTAFIAGPLL